MKINRKTVHNGIKTLDIAPGAHENIKVPEPSTMNLLAASAATGLFFRRRRSSNP